MRTAVSIYRARGWSGIKDQIAYIFRGRIGTGWNDRPQDACYQSWMELRSIRHFSSTARQLLDHNNRILLEGFLDANSALDFPVCANPEISILLILHNKAELTLACLYSLLQSNLISYEIVVVDNASTDQTQRLLQQTTGLEILRNETNVHYLRACNQAAKVARGKCLLLLNNDAQAQGTSIRQAIETLESSPKIGAVGGKVILPDGSLQEAGSIIWQDGSCLGYGRGDYPFAPSYMFQRDVDYCSGVFLLTKRELFLEEGGFDEAYLPAYYEETDFCVRLWKRGLRVVYDPRVTIQHYEFASSQSRETAIGLQAQHQKIFATRHRDWLHSQCAPTPENIAAARMRRRKDTKRILFVEDRVPHRSAGSGYPRSNRILEELVRMGHSVTLWPLQFPQELWSHTYRDISREVEVIAVGGSLNAARTLDKGRTDYDCLLVSRPHNLRALQKIKPRLLAETRVVYDAEAIFCLREIRRLQLVGKEPSPQVQERMIGDEIALAQGCNQVICVSDKEGQEFIRRGFTNVRVLGHALECSPTTSDFGERKDILFVGALDAADSPNADSMRWFCKEIFPRVRQRTGDGVKFIVAGRICEELKKELRGESIEIVGEIADPKALYNQARVFVAPTRFAAGIPYKVHEAAAHGVPVVATRLIESQLGWNNETELLAADDGEGFTAACSRLYQDCALWNRLRENALRRVAIDCSPEEFTSRLRAIIG